MKNELKEGVLVISLEGNLLSEQGSAELMDLLKSNLESGNKKILFNLADVKFVNSTGLGMLLTAVSKVRNAGGEMALCSLPEQTKKLLQMTKLETVFIVRGDEAEGVSFFQGI